MKKLIVLFCLVFAVMLAGCSTAEKPTNSPTASAQATPEAVVLFDTATCKITLDGAETTVEDKTTGEQYSFTTTRKLSTTPPTLEQMQARCIARTSADTDSIKIELAGALIVVHDRAGNQTYYIDP